VLHYALIYFIVALIAALPGFAGTASGTASIARVVCYVFLCVSGVTLMMGLLRRRP